MSTVWLALIGTLVSVVTMVGFSVFELQRTTRDYAGVPAGTDRSTTDDSTSRDA
jgi:hypothetical protein